jgi:hypothetical protein
MLVLMRPEYLLASLLPNSLACLDGFESMELTHLKVCSYLLQGRTRQAPCHQLNNLRSAWKSDGRGWLL